MKAKTNSRVKTAPVLAQRALSTERAISKRLQSFKAADKVVLIGIGAGVVGAVAGALGAIYFPKLIQSDAVQQLSARIGDAKASLGETLAQMKDSMTKKESTPGLSAPQQGLV